MQLIHLLACSYKIDENHILHVVIKLDENHIGKKLSFFHSYREKTQFFPCKNSSTANHEMKKNRKHRKL